MVLQTPPQERGLGPTATVTPTLRCPGQLDLRPSDRVLSILRAWCQLRGCVFWREGPLIASLRKKRKGVCEQENCQAEKREGVARGWALGSAGAEEPPPPGVFWHVALRGGCHYFQQGVPNVSLMLASPPAAGGGCLETG